MLKPAFCLCLLLCIAGCSSDDSGNSAASGNKRAVKAYQEGRKAVEGGDWNKAMSSFRQAVQLDPKFADAHAALGDAYSQLGLDQDAEAAYHKAIGIDPGHARGLCGMGLIYLGKKRYQEAVDSLTNSIKKDPMYIEAYTALAVAYGGQKRPEKALEICDMALGIQAKNAEIYFLKGCFLGQINKQDEAMKAYHQAVEIDPVYSKPPYGMAAMYAYWKNRP